MNPLCPSPTACYSFNKYNILVTRITIHLITGQKPMDFLTYLPPLSARSI